MHSETKKNPRSEGKRKLAKESRVPEKRRAGVKQKHKSQQRLASEHLLRARHRLKASRGVSQWTLNGSMKWVGTTIPILQARKLSHSQAG